jgi:hypothetical protein
MAQKFCDRGGKKTFATVSAQSGHRTHVNECLLLGVKRTSGEGASMSANDPKWISAMASKQTFNVRVSFCRLTKRQFFNIHAAF